MGTASLTYGKKIETKETKGTSVPKPTGKKVSMGRVEVRRMIQLFVCIGLFVAIFVGKGILPAQMEAVTPVIAQLISSDMDVAGVVSQVKTSMAQGDSLTSALLGLADGFFEEDEIEAGDSALYQAQITRLIGLNPEDNLMAQYLGISMGEAVIEEPIEVEVLPEELLVEEEIVEVPLITAVEYDGIPLPDNVTMDIYSLEGLGIDTYITPVDGTPSSGFGWRVHPIYEEMAFHYGFDIAADTGTVIGAFASGTVDYIGENDDYGLYLQISHGGGVTSFYAHCSELLVQEGQSVAVGETVALVGSTGVSTGPHLHLELKVDGVYINPSYYLETSDYA